MKILGIDTATDVLNLAITDKGKIVADYKIEKEKMTHSAIIIPVLKDILDITELGLRDIDGIAVSIGPGSFTGLRIGLATAKGLVFSLSIPIVGVNTLEVYASNWKRLLPAILCPMVKARKGEYYFTLYQKRKNGDDLYRIKPYQCKDWFSIKEELLLLRQPVYIFGYGLREIIENKNGDNCLENIHFMFNEHEPPGAANVALIGEKKIFLKETDSVLELSPFYIRKSAAEIKKDEANKI
ncbi:MAG: tRNA (adenosine(37)-N6)-threonylcarbamoyltransferase complex dimerization subunit type 1 TsaB [Halanaerobiales bacterium]